MDEQKLRELEEQQDRAAEALYRAEETLRASGFGPDDDEDDCADCAYRRRDDRCCPTVLCASL